MKGFIWNQILSIEFRNNLIRIVTGKLYKNKLIVKNSFSIDLPDNIYENGDIKDSQQLSYIIKRQLELKKIRIRNTHILLDTDRIVIREIVLPSAVESSYHEFLHYHIEDFIPIKREDYIIRYMLVDSLFNHETTRLLVMAAPRNLVEGFHKILSNISLKPIVFDIVGNCISKFLAYNEEFGNIASIGIDYSHTNVIVSNQGQLRYNKQVNIGYMEMFEHLKELDLDKYDLIDLLSDESLDCESDVYISLDLANKSFQKLLLREIDLVLRYYLEDESIEKIYLYEDYSKVSNIESVFSDYFNTKCERISILDDIDFNGDLLNYSNCIGGMIRL